MRQIRLESKMRRNTAFFSKLPPILLIHLKRFEYDYNTDTNVKINDYCQYYDEIDLEKYMTENHDQETKYKLFSVLVHSGTGTGSGHYYAFIKAGTTKKWFKMNDEMVSTADPEEVFEANFGGTHTEAKLNEKKEIMTWEATNDSNAYMLVYVRQDQAHKLLKPISENDVPHGLIEEIEKNKKMDEERRKKGEDFFKIYMTSFELLYDLGTPGLTFYKRGNRDEEYATKFLKNKSKRLKMYLRKNFKVYDLLKYISDSTGIPQDQLMIWKISIAKEQINQVLKRSYFVATSPNVLVLSNGVNSNQTKSIFFVHTLDKKRYPTIFKYIGSYNSTFFDITCKNELDFVTYNQSPNGLYQIEDKSDQMEIEVAKDTNGHVNGNGTEKDSSKVEEVLKGANQMFLDMVDEKYVIVFLKVYSYKNGEPSIELKDYFLINKTLKVHDLLEDIQARDYNFDKEDIIIYKEDKKKYLLEPLALTDGLDEETADNGFVCVVEFKGAEFNDPDYVTAQEYYQTLSQRVWVNFINSESKANSYRILDDGNKKYSDIIDIVSKELFQGEVEPERILLKAKWKTPLSFAQVQFPEADNVKLADLVKNDDKVYCEVSKIDVNLLHMKTKCMVFYYSIVNNIDYREEELYLEKNCAVQKLFDLVKDFAFFSEEINRDIEALQEPAELRLTLLDKKKNKLVGQAQNDQPLAQYIQKYRLRLELCLTRFETANAAVGKNNAEKFYPVYCFHATRDAGTFSNPFIYQSKKNVTANQFREGLYEQMKDWEIYCDKKIPMSQEYFNKLKFQLKSELSESKYVRVESDDTYPFDGLDLEAKKYSLEIIHPFAMPSSHVQMRIHT